MANYVIPILISYCFISTLVIYLNFRLIRMAKARLKVYDEITYKYNLLKELDGQGERLTNELNELNKSVGLDYDWVSRKENN